MSMGAYLITATAVWKHGNSSRMRQIPTFLLDPNIQGIFDQAGAEAIARKIIDPFDLFEIHIHAEYQGP